MYSDVSSLVATLAPSLMEGSKSTEQYVLLCCPFHSEKTPSCSVRRDAPVFFCFGCKVSGHISKLLAHAGVSPTMVQGALDALNLPTFDREDRRRRVYGNDPYRGEYILDDIETLAPYHLQMPTDLIRAGFTEQTIRGFGVGWDAVNLRITYPLRNVYGELVGVSGRTTWAESSSRYKVYKQELIGRKELHLPRSYNIEGVKKALIWNFHTFYPQVLAGGSVEEPVVLVEGFKACMWTVQAGYQRVGALVGSYLSELHAELLARAGVHVLLFLDNNVAGATGTEKAAALLHQYGVPFRICDYPDEREQPDHLEVEEVLDAIIGSQSYCNWRTGT